MLFVVIATPSFLSIQHVENEEREHRREGVLVASSMCRHPAERSLLNAVLGGRTPLGLTTGFLSALLHLPHVFVLFFIHALWLFETREKNKMKFLSASSLTNHFLSLPYISIRTHLHLLKKENESESFSCRCKSSRRDFPTSRKPTPSFRAPAPVTGVPPLISLPLENLSYYSFRTNQLLFTFYGHPAEHLPQHAVSKSRTPFGLRTSCHIIHFLLNTPSW